MDRVNRRTYASDILATIYRVLAVWDEDRILERQQAQTLAQYHKSQAQLGGEAQDLHERAALYLQSIANDTSPSRRAVKAIADAMRGGKSVIVIDPYDP